MSWWMLTLIAPAWFLQLVLHELSHLLVGWFHQRLRPLGFYPYPHRHNGRLYFARYVCEAPGAPDPPHRPRHLAPAALGLLQAMLVGLVACSWPSWGLWLLPVGAMGLGDFLWFWRGYFWGTPACDGKRWRYGDLEAPTS